MLGEQVSKETLALFETKVLKRESGDKVYGSIEDAIKGLNRKPDRNAIRQIIVGRRKSL